MSSLIVCSISLYCYVQIKRVYCLLLLLLLLFLSTKWEINDSFSSDHRVKIYCCTILSTCIAFNNYMT